MSRSFNGCFDEEIWNKGLVLYREGRVTHWQERGQSYRAMVVENKPYHVEIFPETSTLHCDCAFAIQGHHCRHMAAAVAAYEANQENQESIKSSQDEWMEQVIPCLSKSVLINNGKAFAEAIHHYLNQSFDIKQSAKERLAAYLRLVEYLIKQSTFYYSFDDLIKETLHKAGELRSFLSPVQLHEADGCYLTFCDKCHDPKLCRSFVDAYFDQDESGIHLAKRIMANSYENHTIYANAVFDRMVTDPSQEKELIAFCELNSDEPRLRKWAIAHYKQEHQYTEGIEFLKRFCTRMKAERQDVSDEQLQLFLFAVMADDTKLRDRCYPIVLHHPLIAKAKLFTGMKEAMQEQWVTIGRTWMIDALPQMSQQERLTVLAQTDCGDLLIHELLMLPDSQTFLPYWECIYTYDRGMLYNFIQKELCSKLDSSAALAEDMLVLWKRLWRTPEDHRSLLHVLIQCKKIYHDHSDALRILTQLEEYPYE